MHGIDILICIFTGLILVSIIFFVIRGVIKGKHQPCGIRQYHYYALHHPPKLKLKYNLILSLLRFVFYYIHYVSVHTYIPYLCPKSKYLAVEIYVIAWLVVEIALFFLLLARYPFPNCIWSVCIWFICIIISYRLFDIFQAWFDQFVLTDS